MLLPLGMNPGTSDASYFNVLHAITEPILLFVAMLYWSLKSQ